MYCFDDSSIIGKAYVDSIDSRDSIWYNITYNDVFIWYHIEEWGQISVILVHVSSQHD